MDEVGGYAAAMTRVLEHRSLRDKLGGVMPELAELGYTGVEVTQHGILLTRDGDHDQLEAEDQVEDQVEVEDLVEDLVENQDASCNTCCCILS